MNYSIFDLKIIPTKGGDVMHALKASEESFKTFGELYFSWILPDTVKAWKKHKIMTMNLIVPIGLVKFVLFDDQVKNRRFHEIVIGNIEEEKGFYKRLTINPNTWFGFKCISKCESLVVNCADIEHYPEEIVKADLESIPYNW
tara:strand:- start:4020 stop:4448 length:429 start_codon:yes stop_codon:yes gene_type:complete